MRRKEPAYRQYLAYALLLTLTECCFFCTDCDRRLSRGAHRLLAMARGRAPTGADKEERYDLSIDKPDAPIEDDGAEHGRIKDAVASFEDMNGSHTQRRAGGSRLELSKKSPESTASSKIPSLQMPERPTHLSSLAATYNAPTRQAQVASGRITQAWRQGSVVEAPGSIPRIKWFAATKPLEQLGDRSFPDHENATRSSHGIRRHWLEPPDWDGSGRNGGDGLDSAISVPYRRSSLESAQKLRERRSLARHFGKRPRGEFKARVPQASLRKLLGFGAIKPPQGRMFPPDFTRVEDKTSLNLPDGRPLSLDSANAEQIERVKPPDSNPAYRQWLAQDERGMGAHWHNAGSRQYLHQTSLWAVGSGNQMTPMMQSGGHWWTLAQGDQPLVWNQGHWWWKEGDAWFLLHNGQPWAYRWFGEWQHSGLLNPETDTKIVYSSDEMKAAVITPGVDTVLFDLSSGNEIRRWPSAPTRSRIR